MIKDFFNWLGIEALDKFGQGVAITGIAMEQISMIVIVLGILLWMVKNTKVFKFGLICYFVGLFVEIFGSLLMK